VSLVGRIGFLVYLFAIVFPTLQKLVPPEAPLTIYRCFRENVWLVFIELALIAHAMILARWLLDPAVKRLVEEGDGGPDSDAEHEPTTY
jgi:hypothetical protein